MTAQPMKRPNKADREAVAKMLKGEAKSLRIQSIEHAEFVDGGRCRPDTVEFWRKQAASKARKAERFEKISAWLVQP